MIVVVAFHESLDLVPASLSLLGHLLRDGTRIPVNSGDDSMAVTAFRSPLVVVFQDDCFPASIPTTQDDHHFARLHNLHHLDAGLFGQLLDEEKSDETQGPDGLNQRKDTENHTFGQKGSSD